MNTYSYNKCRYSTSTTNRASLTILRSACSCGSNEFIVINANQTSSRMNSHLKCVKCGKEWGISYG